MTNPEYTKPNGPIYSPDEILAENLAILKPELDAIVDSKIPKMLTVHTRGHRIHLGIPCETITKSLRVSETLVSVMACRQSGRYERALTFEGFLERGPEDNRWDVSKGYECNPPLDRGRVTDMCIYIGLVACQKISQQQQPNNDCVTILSN